MILARDESLFYQPIDGHTDGSRSEPDLRADGVDRKRALMQENSQDAKIGVAQSFALDAPARVGEQSQPKSGGGRSPIV